MTPEEMRRKVQELEDDIENWEDEIDRAREELNEIREECEHPDLEVPANCISSRCKDCLKWFNPPKGTK